MMRNKMPTAIRNFLLVLSRTSILSVECTIPNIRMANPANAISISTLCMMSVVFVIILFLPLIIKHTFALGCKVCVYFCVNIKKNSYRIRTVTVFFLVIIICSHINRMLLRILDAENEMLNVILIRIFTRRRLSPPVFLMFYNFFYKRKSA